MHNGMQPELNEPQATPSTADDLFRIYQFFNEIGIIDSLSTSHLERVLPAGLKKSHFGVLNHMVRLGKQESPAELAAAFQVARPSMTNTLQKLEAKGYIEIVPHPKDGRSKLALITPAGRAIRQEAIEAIIPLFEPLLAVIDRSALDAAMPVLEAVRAYMDENR